VIVGALASWGSRHVYRRAALVHAGCGHAVSLGYFCPGCGERVRGADVRLERGRRADAPRARAGVRRRTPRARPASRKASG
jgi:hypothetical protein